MNFFKALFGNSTDVDIKALLDEGAQIVDVRSKQEFESGHAKGSINIPLVALPNFMNKLKGKDHPIILVCASGMRASQAKGQLEREGYQKVYNAGNWQNANA
ncbi:rhodanese-like domain-containing protein [Sediminitomix flava]|uniref:Rhodanese-related sulfurtransferase n=1 Tax=Sediminitomix flava TaxID=379075 RepID=A0A315Z9C3_SEDFL|nr:rhodanese-like domain-containing protein [Sediminitomix flava]PWJ40156.1 rhodanese-related sulfurtransferase [Sediminitomix flava]